MTDDRQVTLSFTDAQRIFDLAVSGDIAASGHMDLDDVHSMRRLAEALGVDPSECTGSEFVTRFPHSFCPGRVDLGSYRQRVTFTRPDSWNASDIRVIRPETDDEVIARLGGVPHPGCGVGLWGRECGKPADDPIHVKKGIS